MGSNQVIKGIKLILVWLVGIYGVFTVARILIQFRLFDFAIYYQSVLDLQSGINMYLDSTIAMKYPLSGMLVLYPIGWLPYAVAEKLWTIVSLSSLGLGLWWIAKIVPRLPWQEWIVIGGAVVLAFPYKFTLGMGQINLIILALLAGSLYSFSRGREGWAGTLLAIAAWIKITPLLLLLFFWRKRGYRVVMAAGLVYLLGWVLAGAVWGFDLVTYFWREVVPTISMAGNRVYYNQALTGLLARADIADQAAQIINYVVLGILLWASYLVTPKKWVGGARDLVAYGLFVASMLLGAGLAWQHYFVWTVFLFVGIWAMLTKRGTINIFPMRLLLVAYGLISINLVMPQTIPASFQLVLSHMTIGTLLLWGLGYRLLRSENNPDL